MLRSPVSLEEWIALDAVVPTIDGSGGDDNSDAAQNGYSESDGGQSHGGGQDGTGNASSWSEGAEGAPISIMPLNIGSLPGYFSSMPEYSELYQHGQYFETSYLSGSDPFCKFYANCLVPLGGAGFPTGAEFAASPESYLRFECLTASSLEIGFDYFYSYDANAGGIHLYFKNDPAQSGVSLDGATMAIKMYSDLTNQHARQVTFYVAFPGVGLNTNTESGSDAVSDTVSESVPQSESMLTSDIVPSESQLSRSAEWDWDEEWNLDEFSLKSEDVELEDIEIEDTLEVASAALGDASHQLGVLATALGNLRDQSVDTLDSLREDSLQVMRDILDRGDDLAENLGREIAMLREAAQSYANTAPDLRDGILFESVESGAFRILTAGGEATAMASGLDAVAGLLRPFDSADVESESGMVTPEALHAGFDVAFAKATSENVEERALLDQERIQSEAFKGRRGDLTLDL